MSPRKPAWKPASTGTAQHRDWLALVDVDGPFLSLPVLVRAWPNGMDRLESGREPLRDFLEAQKVWLRRPAAQHEAWMRSVLSGLCQWDELLVTGTELPGRLTVDVPEHGISLRPWGALFAPKADPQVEAPLVVVHTVTPGTLLRSVPDDGWAASPVDRLATGLRRLDVPIGVVTDGRWWAVVWAVTGSATGSGLFDAAAWGEEPLLRDAFAGLLGIQRLVGVREEERLPALFAASLLAQEEITEALGTQVRRAVELLVQAFSEARLEARRTRTPDPLPDSPREVYEAAVTLLMRVVFLLFAEERGLLPIDRDLYRSSYAVSGLLDELEERAREGEELLDDSTGAWHRLLAVSRAIHDGASFEDVRMPAYGGSLFRPNRFPWFEALDESGGLRLRVSDRVVLHLLRAVQVVTTAGQARRVSFREIDVEQIGYVYEGLLGYTTRDTDDRVILGLAGKRGEEPEIDLDLLEEITNDASTPAAFADALLKHLGSTQPGSKAQTKNQIAKAFVGAVDEADVRSGLAAVCQHDEALVQRVLPFVALLRHDLRGLPYVVPAGGLVVVETASRKNAGAHYTPRALAEEVVLHALEPLVYGPGPLQTADRDQWKLKSSAEILELKVADIAAGSGAFLVAAARYLSARLVEAWRNEEAVPDVGRREDDDGLDDPLTRLAMREVIARCLYGADINEMAVEMCKLSLWLVSLDPDKPFSFVDDKILLGNSLLGLTSLDQLRGLHIAPSPQRLRNPGFTIDVEGDLQQAARLRREIASSPVDDVDPQRTAEHKAALLQQTEVVTARLRDVADGIVATGLTLGGKPGKALEAAYEHLSLALLQAYPPAGGEGDRQVLRALLEEGLTPTVETDYSRWQPLHWIIEVPDVMERGGFDAIIGNPPFLVAKKLSSAVGSNLREWFSNIVGGGPGKCDMVAYFIRRAAKLTGPEATLGLIGAKSVAEGDTRDVALSPLIHGKWTLFRAVRSMAWPSRLAATDISLLWLSRARVDSACWLDGRHVRRITPSLDDDALGAAQPKRLPRPKTAHKGSVLQGDGFLLTEAEANHLLSADPRMGEIVHPYLNGEDVNSSPTQSGSRWVVDFREMTELQARRYPLGWQRLEDTVRPERLKKDATQYPRMVHEWWKHWNTRVALYEALEHLESVIVLSTVSKHVVPAKVSARQVFSSALVVWPSQDDGFFALLSSNYHRFWAEQWGSTMGQRFRYSLSDVYETLPLPPALDALAESGSELLDLQRHLCKSMGLGLTKLYSALNNPKDKTPQLSALRELHVDLDALVAEAYGFKLIQGKYGWSEFRGVLQFGPNDEARSQMLSDLMSANRRAADPRTRR